jgi:hypothetical protein
MSQFQPWQLLLLILAGWINRRQQDAVECLITENRNLREKLGKKRILLFEGNGGNGEMGTQPIISSARFPSSHRWDRRWSWARARIPVDLPSCP